MYPIARAGKQVQLGRNAADARYVAGALQRRDFRLLNRGQFVSDFGRQLTVFALPTIAILDLHANARTVTAVTAVEYGMIPVLGMLAGVLLDRWRRRKTMIAANVVRSLALASIPLAALLHVLTIAQLLVAAAVVSIAGLFFDTAYQPFLATIVGRDGYAEGNARMTLSAQIAAALGNALGGPLVGVLGGPLALVGNLCTYAFGTGALVCMQTPEPRFAETRRSFRADAREGCVLVLRDSRLRALAIATAIVYLGGTLVDSVLPLYAYRTLHLSPIAFGCMLAFAAAGTLVTTRLGRIGTRFGTPAVLVLSSLGIAAGDLLCALPILTLGAIVTGRALVSATAPLYEMTVQEVATGRVADSALARMNAALRTLTNLTIPLGCFASGAVVTITGCVPVMLSGAGIIIAGSLALAIMLAAGRTKSCSFSTTTTSAMPSAA